MARFFIKVIVPAQMQTPQGTSPDRRPRYDGGVAAPNGATPVNVGPAVVTGGTLIGKKWMGCTYIAPPFTIPGFCEVQML